MKTFVVLCLLLLAGLFPSRADELMRRAQEELRKRSFYFGEIDGRKTKEVSGAIRRYQERKGFAATGELDDDTLRSLEIMSGPATGATESGHPAETWPDVPVLRSDAARIVESDRRLLDKLERNGTPPPAVAEPPRDTENLSSSQASGAKRDAAREREIAAQPASKKSLARTAQRDPEAEPPAVPRASVTGPLAQRAEAFVREYLETCERNAVAEELAFYDERVNYFDHGTVGREFIKRDVSRYHKRWPRQDFDLLDFQIAHRTGNELEVRFRLGFRVQNAHHSVSGKTDNVFKIRHEDGQMRFVSLKEERLRE
jgi:peptidoglycan hydrolase-like protein with peptidoglycan-binding domain